MRKYVEENLERGFIKPFKEAFITLILFIFKFNGEFRFYINYRKLNVIIEKDTYIIPLIKELIKYIIYYK